MLLSQLEELIRSALQKSGESGDLKKVEVLREMSERGDFSCAIAPKLARRNTVVYDLAQAIAKHLDSELLERIDIAENGFINMFVTPKALAAIVHDLLNGKLPEPFHGASSSSTIGSQDMEQTLYAWHRLSAALRQLTEPRVNLLDCCLDAPLIELDEWLKIERRYLAHIDALVPAFDSNIAGSRMALANKKLALNLDEFLSVPRGARESKPYLVGVASCINQSPVLDGLVLASPTLRNARIGLISAAKRVLGVCLGILKVPVSDKL